TRSPCFFHSSTGLQKREPSLTSHTDSPTGTWQRSHPSRLLPSKRNIQPRSLAISIGFLSILLRSASCLVFQVVLDVVTFWSLQAKDKRRMRESPRYFMGGV